MIQKRGKGCIKLLEEFLEYELYPADELRDEFQGSPAFWFVLGVSVIIMSGIAIVY